MGEHAAEARYRTIATWLRAQCVERGPGAALPTENDVATRFGVSRMTARKAFTELEAGGLIERRRRAGSFVRPQPLRRADSLLRPFTDEITRRGMVPSSSVLFSGLVTDADESHKLGLPRESFVVRIDRVRCADGLPVAIERATLPKDYASVLEHDLEQTSLHAALADAGARPERAVGHVRAELASPAECEHLEVSNPTPLLVEERVLLDAAERAVESTRTAYVGSRWFIDTRAAVSPAASS